MNYQVSLFVGNKLSVATYPNIQSAIKHYENSANLYPEAPRKLQTCAKNPVILKAHNWDISNYKFEMDYSWREDAKARLQGVLTRPQIENVLEVPVKDLKNYVAARNVDQLTNIKLIGKPSAIKLIRALRAICKASKVRQSRTHEFTRLTLNRDRCVTNHEIVVVDGKEVSKNIVDDFIVDTIRKSVSPIEAKAMELGGPDAIIHCVSWIKDPKKGDIDDWGDHLRDVWSNVVNNGIELNGKIYDPLGHGTNSAKGCKTIWVLREILEEMRSFANASALENWKTTAAKGIAYKVGLKAVATKPINVPIRPDEVLILDDVEDTIFVNVVKEYLDGHEEYLDNYPVKINRTDGFFMIDIVERKEAELYNRLLEKYSPEEADKILKVFINNTSARSYRCVNAAVKGLGCQNFDWHEFLHDKGIHVLNGRNIDDYIIIMFKSVLKVGPGGAYASLEDWFDAVGVDIGLSVCVNAHNVRRKNVSYQVLQCLTEASNESIRGLCSKTIERINGMHTVDGASKVVNKELGQLIRMDPTAVNVPFFKEVIGRSIETNINDVFGGKTLKACVYAFIMPDPVWILQKAFGLPVTGCLDAGEFHCGKIATREYSMWRSPVVHPNSIRVMKNVAIKKEYQKYFKSDEFVFMMNCFDDTSMAMDADFDGDHANASDDESLIAATKETLKTWNRLIVWETPTADKIIVDRKAELKYFANLTRQNELGLTVYGLNALLNGILKKKDPVTRETCYKYVGVSQRGVNFKKFASNVLVDASKHGGATIAEPAESAICSNMVQPWAKMYRDKVNAGATKEQLDKFADYRTLNKDWMRSTLNKIFALYCAKINRSLEVEDAPAESFDCHKIMFDPAEGIRGLSGLIRKGEILVSNSDGTNFCVDQGLFDSLARRIDEDRVAWEYDQKDTEDTSFEEAWRINALAEIEDFAVSAGATLRDAYDVITLRMFEDCDRLYKAMNGKLDWMRDRLWKAYLLIFGGMMLEAYEENLDKDADLNVENQYPI